MEPIQVSFPGFGSLADQIKALEEEQNNEPSLLRDMQLKHKAILDEFADKIRKENERYIAEEAKLRGSRHDRITKIRALKLEQQRIEESKGYEETAKLVKEICASFESWSAAHEYQVEDIISCVHAYLHPYNGFLNANDMGLGKTYESIVALYIIGQLFQREHNRMPRILWLTKSQILKTGSTVNEIRRWWPEFRIAPLSGSMNPTQRGFMFDVVRQTGLAVITNYETLRTTQEAADMDWDIIVYDECHKLKGGANYVPTAIFKAVNDVARRSRFNIMLSGTPMTNRIMEMWSYLHIFDPILFPDVKKFEKDFGEYKTLAGQYVLEIDPNKILMNALKGRMVRRTRYEVGLQLPELTYIDRLCEHTPEQEKAYNQMRESFFVWLDKTTEPLTATAIIAQMTRLRQINVWPDNIKLTQKDDDGNKIVVATLNIKESGKIDECMDIITNANDQVLVFGNFNEPFKEIQRRCKEVITDAGVGLTCKIISGDTKDDMAMIEQDFQQGKIDVLCINSAMGEGINLQKNPDYWPGGAAIGIHLDWWWNSARQEQCVGRYHRQGAKIPCFVYNLFVDPSIDNFMIAMCQEKDERMGSIMNSDIIRPAAEWKKFLKGMI